MASSSYSDANEALVTALEAQAKYAAEANTPSSAKAYSQAALNLAEALAWLRSPAQSHGGGSAPSD